MSAARMSGSVDGVAPSRAPIGAVSVPPDPRAIGEALARLQTEYDDELLAVNAKYRARFAELHAQWIRARVQRSVA